MAACILSSCSGATGAGDPASVGVSESPSQGAPRASTPSEVNRKPLQIGRSQALSPEQIAVDSNRELARRLVVAGVPIGTGSDPQNWNTAEDLARQGIGGVLLLGDTRGTSADQVREHLKAVKGAADTSTHGVGSRSWIISDEEGGGVQRMAAITGDEPSATELGKLSHTKIRAKARAYGDELKAAGIDAVYAPVADVGTQGWLGKNERTFADSPRAVAQDALAWAQGMADAGLATTAKHWPGHGGVQEDTHSELASTDDWSSLQRSETAAFTPLLNAGIPMVMVAHLQVPGLTGQSEAASVSPQALKELRAQAGDQTVIVTDDLAMGAITSNPPRGMALTQPEAAVRALKAGADMVIVNSTEVAATVKAIAQAIDSGVLPRDQVVQKAVRIANARTESPADERALSGSG